MGIFKKLDYADPQVQVDIEYLIIEAAKVKHGESTLGSNMNDIFLNFHIDFALKDTEALDSMELEDEDFKFDEE